MVSSNLNKLLFIVLLSFMATSVFADKMTKSLANMIKLKNSTINYVERNSQNKFLAKSFYGGDKLLVDIGTSNLTAEDRILFELPGVEIKAYSTKYNRISLSVSDVTQLVTIEAIDKVAIMSLNFGSRTHAGAVTSRALATMRPPIPLTVTGKGQKIGIISNSFARTKEVTGKPIDLPTGNTSPIVLTGTLNQLSGDLPDTIDLRNDNAAGEQTDEGAAMAELAYDIAPDSAIAFYASGDSEAEFAAAINDLCTTAKSTVIVDDISQGSEPNYQTGIIAQAAAECTKRGIPYFSAAGNDANVGIREQFKDVSVINDTATPPTGVDFHEWSNGTPYLRVNIAAGGELQVVLQWNQPFQNLNAAKGSEIDLNLYVYGTPDLLNPIPQGSGTDIQAIKNGVAAPFGNAMEGIMLINNSGADKSYYFAIDNLRGSLTNIPQDAGTPLEFTLAFSVRNTLLFVEGIVDKTSRYGATTIYGHAAAVGVISVAAVPWYDSNTPGYQAENTKTAMIDPEDTTSRGGNFTVFFDRNGDFNPVTKFLPDIAAVDGNNTTFFGSLISAKDPTLGAVPGEPDNFLNFFGTSAAAPNAAAVTALALEINPELSPEDIVSYLKSTAQDVTGYRASVGVDDVTGAGLIDIQAFLSKVSIEKDKSHDDDEEKNSSSSSKHE
ncbi:MAG: S8 family serine peptidase [Thiohalomonadales bacterium]